MGKKGIIKVAAVIMAVIMMTVGTVQPLYAADISDNIIDVSENEIMPLSLDATKSTSLTISGGTAKATCRVVGTSKTVDKIVINMYLQKKNSNGVWNNYKSWYATKSSYVYTLTKACYVPSGTYRVMARVICYNDSDAETSYMYTGSKTR